MMFNKHIKYLKYLINHKKYVFQAGLKTKAPLIRLIIHDWSKILPSEWLPYVNYFYGNLLTDEEFKAVERCLGCLSAKYSKHYWNQEFDKAWLKHQKRNKHHWQYWILIEDSGNIKRLTIPDKYIREMVADWAGAGRAITGQWDVYNWYYKNKDFILLEEQTRIKVEKLLELFK